MYSPFWAKENNMKILGMVAVCLALVGCAEGNKASINADLFGPSLPPTIVVTHVHDVVLPDPSIYKCDRPGPVPRASTLTDIQVGSYVTQLYHNNIQCYQTVQAIRDFLTSAQSIVNADNKTPASH